MMYSCSVKHYFDLFFLFIQLLTRFWELVKKFFCKTIFIIKYLKLFFFIIENIYKEFNKFLKCKQCFENVLKTT